MKPAYIQSIRQLPSECRIEPAIANRVDAACAPSVHRRHLRHHRVVRAAPPVDDPCVSLYVTSR